MIRSILLKIKTEDTMGTVGESLVGAFQVAPGIAVNAETLMGWNVTHMRSGIAFVKWLDTKREAVRLARRLAELGNWDRPKSKLPKTLMAKGYSLCKEFCRG